MNVEFTIERAEIDPPDTVRAVLTVKQDDGTTKFMLIGDPESEDSATERGHRVRAHFYDILVELGYVVPEAPN